MPHESSSDLKICPYHMGTRSHHKPKHCVSVGIREAFSPQKIILKCGHKIISISLISGQCIRMLKGKVLLDVESSKIGIRWAVSHVLVKSKGRPDNIPRQPYRRGVKPPEISLQRYGILRDIYNVRTTCPESM
jgi:hypothetical protein